LLTGGGLEAFDTLQLPVDAFLEFCIVSQPQEIRKCILADAECIILSFLVWHGQLTVRALMLCIVQHYLADGGSGDTAVDFAWRLLAELERRPPPDIEKRTHLAQLICAIEWLTAKAQVDLSGMLDVLFTVRERMSARGHG
jgi:hypothetical protein